MLYVKTKPIEYQTTVKSKFLQRVEQGLTKWRDLLNVSVVILAVTKKLCSLNFNPYVNVGDNIDASTLDDSNHYSDIV